MEALAFSSLYGISFLVPCGTSLVPFRKNPILRKNGGRNRLLFFQEISSLRVGSARSDRRMSLKASASVPRNPRRRNLLREKFIVKETQVSETLKAPRLNSESEASGDRSDYEGTGIGLTDNDSCCSGSNLPVQRSEMNPFEDENNADDSLGKSVFLKESAVWNKLETWIEQSKKENEFWGIGTGPIFTICQDSIGHISRVLVNENEIARRCKLDGWPLISDREEKDEEEQVLDVNLRISRATLMANEIMNGGHKILKNSSIVKIVVEGKKASYADGIRSVLQSKTFLKYSHQIGFAILCTCFIFWAAKNLFAKNDRIKLTMQQKKMLRSKFKARKDRSRLEKGAVEVVQNPPDMSLLTKRPNLDQDELVKILMKSKLSKDKMPMQNLTETVSVTDQKFENKVMEIRAMAKKARESERQDLQVDRAQEEGVAFLEKNGLRMNFKNSTVNSSEDTQDIGSKVNNVEAHVRETEKVLLYTSSKSSFPSSETPLIVKPKIITSVKEAREYIGQKAKISSINITSSKNSLCNGYAEDDIKSEPINIGDGDLKLSNVEASGHEQSEKESNLDFMNTLYSFSDSDAFHSEKVDFSKDVDENSTQLDEDVRSLKNATDRQIMNLHGIHDGVNLLQKGIIEHKDGNETCEEGKENHLSQLNVRSDHTLYAKSYEESTLEKKNHHSFPPQTVPEAKSLSKDTGSSEIFDVMKLKRVKKEQMLEGSDLSKEHTTIDLETEPEDSKHLQAKKNWLDKNYHEFEPFVEKIGAGFRENYKLAKENKGKKFINTKITELGRMIDEEELAWMEDDRLREIVIKVRDNELGGRDPFHLMTGDDQRAFFKGLEVKAENMNSKLLGLHEWIHSRVENLDYGADGISLHDPLENVIPRWKGPVVDKIPEFLNNSVKAGNFSKSSSANDADECNLQNREVLMSSDVPVPYSPVQNVHKVSPNEAPMNTRTVVECSDGSSRAGKKIGKENWQHTKKWSREFLEVYNSETDPDMKSIMKDIGKDLDRWITEKEIQDAADLMTRLPKKRRKFIEKKLDKLKREMEMFGPQAVVSKYREYAEEKEEDYLWWLDLQFVLCIELYRLEDGIPKVGFYSLEMAPDLELNPKQYHVIAFEDPGDSKNFCYILQAHLEMLGNGSAFVVAQPPKDAFREAKTNGFQITVIRKGALKLNIDQILEEVEGQIVEIGSKIYQDRTLRERSVDMGALINGVFASSKFTKKRSLK